MAISYNTIHKRLEVTYNAGDTKGTTTANPWTFEDIYQYCIANPYGIGLGVATKTGNSYFFDNLAIIILGDVHFIDKDKTITFTGSDTTQNQYFLQIFPQLSGKLTDCKIDALGITNPGWSRLSANGATEMIGCTISNIFYFDSYAKTRNSFLNNIYYPYIRTGAEYVNTNFVNCSTIWFWGNGVVDNCTILNSTSGVFVDAANAQGSISVRNVKLVNSNKDLDIRLGRYNLTFELIDCTADFGSYMLGNLTGSYSTTSRCTVVAKSTFNFSIATENYNLKVYDKNNTLVANQDVIGNQYSEEIQYDYRTAYGDNGTIIENIRETSGPFKVVISKTGYDDLTIPDINVIAGQPTVIRGELVLTAPPKPEITGVAIVQASSQTAADGQITIIAASGTQPYQYSLNGVDWQATGVFSGLAKGTYEVHVKDDNDLTDSINGVEVPGDASPIYVDRRLSANIGVQELSCDIKTIELTATIS